MKPADEVAARLNEVMGLHVRSRRVPPEALADLNKSVEALAIHVRELRRELDDAENTLRRAQEVRTYLVNP